MPLIPGLQRLGDLVSVAGKISYRLPITQIFWYLLKSLYCVWFPIQTNSTDYTSLCSKCKKNNNVFSQKICVPILWYATPFLILNFLGNIACSVHVFCFLSCRYKIFILIVSPILPFNLSFTSFTLALFLFFPFPCFFTVISTQERYDMII